MVKRRSALAWWVLPLAASAYADGMPKAAAPLHVATVSVMVNGGWSDRISGDETPESCRSFLLSPAQVERYFRRARQVSERAYAHDLDASRCHAAGKLRLKDGRVGEWEIDSERRGLLILEGGQTLYFHCAACTAPPFGEP